MERKENNVGVSYRKLWILLLDRNMSKAELRRAAGISPNTMTKMRKDEPVQLSILEKICHVLHCDFGDIISHVELPSEAAPK